MVIFSHAKKESQTNENTFNKSKEKSINIKQRCGWMEPGSFLVPYHGSTKSNKHIV